MESLVLVEAHLLQRKEYTGAVYFLYDERHRQHDGRPDLLERRQQDRRDRRLVKIPVRGALRYAVDEAKRALIGMRQREYRQEPVDAVHPYDRSGRYDVGNQVLVRQHHTFGVARRPGGIQDGGERVFLYRRKGRGRAGPEGGLASRRRSERLHGYGRPLVDSDLGSHLLRYRDGFGLRMGDDVGYLLGDEVREDRYDHITRGGGAEVRDAPFGPVFRQDDHAVALFQARRGELAGKDRGQRRKVLVVHDGRSVHGTERGTLGVGGGTLEKDVTERQAG